MATAFYGIHSHQKSSSLKRLARLFDLKACNIVWYNKIYGQ